MFLLFLRKKCNKIYSYRDLNSLIFLKGFICFLKNQKKKTLQKSYQQQPATTTTKKTKPILLINIA